MTSVFASRRRAEEFHSLVEAPGPRSAGDAHLEDFLSIVESLRAVPTPEPRPEFVASLREELMAAADTLLVPTPSDERLTLPPRNARRERRIAAAIGGLAVVGAGTSMAVAAQTALPGEMLYPLKRTIEDARAEAASDPDAKALTLLDNASSRLAELEALGREGELAEESTAVSTSFEDFGAQADEAAQIILADYARTGDQALVRELRDFTGDSMDTLEALEAVVPPAARPDLLAAVELITDIDARALQLCPSCGGAGVEQIPPVLLSSAATDPQIVVIPGATVEAWRPTADPTRILPGRRSPRGERGPSGAGSGSDGSSEPVVSAGGQQVPDVGAGSGSDGGTSTGPLGDIADTLTGGKDSPVSNGGTGGLGGTGGGGSTGGGLVDDTLEDVGKTVKDTVDETEQQLNDTIDQLGDSLLGN